ncbi:hypothetical protein GCM10022223_33240 [Kineosporia mesophila]|uniref:Alpha-L-rhamnosidase n=1 Tax=Kineosporia mesophila TaxID=566012 RepID=A0ABP6ZPM4_9ACTN|nr:alpha-L-rhamnosidase C-terminal domain-containing protein [Kineosporia mesophila]MCD5353687.1 hypothetical protein [Kineosporia mesophila]
MSPQQIIEVTAGTSDRRPQRGQWQSYVLGPHDDDVSPERVLRTSGGVTVGRYGIGDITLSRRPGDPEPEIVLDYGRNVSGVPYFQIDAASYGAHLRASYSESAAWTVPEGDVEGSHNESGHRERFEEFTLTGAGTVSSGRIQGGQRYQRIALTSTGSVTLRRTGFRFTAFRATAEDYQGWFLSSSDQMNRVWYEGAYTVQLNQLPANTLPRPWTLADGHLDADGGTIAVLSDQQWEDVVVEFDVQIVRGAAGWVVRADGDGRSGYLLTLAHEPGKETTHVLRLFRFDDSIDHRPQDLDRRLYPVTSTGLSLPAGDEDEPWHHIRTEVAAAVLRTHIDGTGPYETGIADGPGPGAGTVGLRVAWLDHARFRNLVVLDPEGAELYANGLAAEDALSAWTGPALGHPDPLPVILDGGKRDRTVWSGDLLVQIPNVFHTSGQEPYVRGSIEFLNGYQEPTGQSAARVPPIMPPARAPRSGQTYSAVYSMHQITNIALHHRYTADTEFLRTQWSAVLRELEFDRSLLDHRGLIVTDENNGLDWDWYDGPKLGAVSAYNVSAYIALRHVADLADALGATPSGPELREQAARLREAINAHLYDQDRHLYVLSDVLTDSVAQDANALAVLSGVVPDGEGPAVLAALGETLPQTPFGPSPFTPETGFWDAVSPYVADMHLRALFHTGQTEAAFDLLHMIWGYMADSGEHATGTAWELIGVDGAPGFGAKTSLAHGWGAGATAALSTYVLGISPVSAGFRSWSFAPQMGDLKWAQGRVPTPHGPIDASWERDGVRLTLTITAPEGTSGQIVVPVAADVDEAFLAGEDGLGNSFSLVRTAEGPGTLVLPVTSGGSYRVDVR